MNSFWQAFNLNLLDNFSLITIFDIGIITFVIYKLIMLIRGTRAVQLLKGLAVLLIATSFSTLFNLYTLQWLLEKVLTALVVALPIVFQPELRRALEKIGDQKFLGHTFIKNKEEEKEIFIKELLEAVYNMSHEKIGALIVLERNTLLGEYVDSGILIEGLVSKELLMNIFVPKTPLHDGAVIVRGNKILAAACVLPLTQEKRMDKELGTRHRSGLGISEVSDSLVIIVSEETGKVSLAIEGVLLRGLDETTLTNRLSLALQDNKRQFFDLSSLWQRR